MQSYFSCSTLMLIGMLTTGAAAAGELQDAAKQGDVAKLEQLIAGGADINGKDRNGRTPLHIVAALGRDDAVIEVLLAKGARINERDKSGESPLGLAISWGQGLDRSHTVALLLAKGADVNARSTSTGATPLHAAATRGSLEKLRMVFPNIPDIALRAMARHDSVDSVEITKLLIF